MTDTGERAPLRTSAIGSELTVWGDVDASNAATLRRAIDRLPEGDRTIITSDLTFIDCAGLSTLLAATADTERSGGRLVLRRPSRALDRIIELTDTDGRLTTER